MKTNEKNKTTLVTKKKDKLRLKSAAFRSKLHVVHAERARKKHATDSSKRRKGTRRKKHALDFASFEQTIQGLGKRYGGDANALRMKDVTVTSEKQRARVVEEERGRMEAVLGHPVFKEDPFKAVMGHLVATLGADVGGREDAMDGT